MSRNTIIELIYHHNKLLDLTNSKTKSKLNSGSSVKLMKFCYAMHSLSCRLPIKFNDLHEIDCKQDPPLVSCSRYHALRCGRRRRNLTAKF
jgi:hypothetical protein